MSADAKDHRSPLDLIKRLLAALPLPAFVVDEQHSVHYLNSAARQRAPELVGEDSPCYARVFHRDAPCELCVMSEVSADGADEVLCSQEIGGQQVRATGTRFVDADGKTYVAEVVHMGGEGLVSSRTSMDLREDAMQSVIDSSNEVVLLFDREYRPVVVNRVAQQTLGYTAAEFAELNFVDLGIAKSTDELGLLLAKADSGAPATARAAIVSAQGGKIPVKVSLSLLVGSSTRVVGACTFAAPRYSNTALPAHQRSVSGPLPRPGRASGPLPKPGSGPGSGTLPKPGSGTLAGPMLAPGPASGPVPRPPSATRPVPPSRPEPPPGASGGVPTTTQGGGAGGGQQATQSLEALAGNLESDSTVLRKAAGEKRKGSPPAPPPPTPDHSSTELEELESALLELDDDEVGGGPPPTPPKTPPTVAPPKAAPPKAAPPKAAPPKAAPPKAAPPKAAPPKAAPPKAAPPKAAPPKAAPPKAAPPKAAPPKAAPPKAAPPKAAPPKAAPPKAAPPKAAPPKAAPPKAAPAQPPPREVTVHVVAEPSVVAAASETIEALLGYTSTEVVTWTAQDWFTRVHEPQLAQDLENMWQGLVGQVFEPGALPDQVMEYPLIRKDGSVVDCSTTWRAVQGANGSFEGLEVVIRPKPL